MEIFKPFDINYACDPVHFEPKDIVIRRNLEQIYDIFTEPDKALTILKKENPVVVDVFMAPIPETIGHLMVVMTVVYPGKVGEEYYMTKGHIHSSDTAPEAYITLKGEGKLIMQTPDDDCFTGEIKVGKINYIPSGWAHRSVNTGKEELIFLGIYPAESERDYSFIGKGRKNFLKIVIEKKGLPQVVDNPISIGKD